MYVLKHGSHYVCDPDACKPGSSLMPPRIDLCLDCNQAWRLRSLDEALEKANLLRMIRGWSCHVQAVD
jgi:hypothetical protein